MECKRDSGVKLCWRVSTPMEVQQETRLEFARLPLADQGAEAPLFDQLQSLRAKISQLCFLHHGIMDLAVAFDQPAHHDIVSRPPLPAFGCGMETPMGR